MDPDDTTTTTTPATPPPGRWSPAAVFGILCFIGAIVTRRALTDPAIGSDIADGLWMLGGALLGWSPPLPSVGKVSPGKLSIIVGLLGFGSSLIIPGCATTIEGHRLTLTIEAAPDLDPPCAVRLTFDDGRALGRFPLTLCPPLYDTPTDELGPSPTGTAPQAVPPMAPDAALGDDAQGSLPSGSATSDP